MVTKDQRRRQLAREKFERQQARRVDHHRKSRRRNAVIAAVIAVVVAAGGTAWAAGAFDGSSKKKDDAAGATPSATPSGTAAPTKVPDPCAKPEAGNPGTATWKKAPAMAIDKSAKYTFTLKTTCGDIPIALDAAKAPATVNSFKFLADKGFFDHTRCHRLTTNGIYVLQCGDPTAKGSGGPGYTIPDENLTAFGKADATSGTVVYPAGTVAMANSGPNTGGSQFFLVYKDSPLQPNYTPFGTMSADGLKALDKIAAAGDNSGGQGDGAPNATAVINKATVSKS
ncbi:peptidylprolyl isomerase [Streptomyces sp. NBC_01477]|uniref:peptidylprolyl isomerase n=1 Tax=Streptomyces sp. NBC_01477 TaxID=2976015 RepID=UPI002E30F432|nr:peptidylprolyl isomerase [Streptomyces sp. NBC_01477]